MPTLPSGVTINAPQLTPTPTQINSNPDATVVLIDTYLAPLLSGLSITPPSGCSVAGFTFRIFPQGNSIAQVIWAVE